MKLPKSIELAQNIIYSRKLARDMKAEIEELFEIIELSKLTREKLQDLQKEEIEEFEKIIRARNELYEKAYPQYAVKVVRK